ncbi:MAG: serine/threonine protein kinase [Planctomycetia bacterium]|nr:serine/threonine protein kinase [Planctomycetia bacterium]
MRWWSRKGIAKLFSRAGGKENAGVLTSTHRDTASPTVAPRDFAGAKTGQFDVTMVVSPPDFDSDSDQADLLTPHDSETSRSSSSDGFADTLPPEPSSYIARQLNGVAGYDILEELGRGGMGVVYRARHRNLQRQVALKMILAGAHAGEAGLARFRAEAEAVAQLQHPNIVQVFEIGEHDGCPYFSLELVTGGSLDKRIRESALSPQAAARLLETLARAIGFAHQRGIIHRDLKPANILLAPVESQASTITTSDPSLRRQSLSNSTITGSDWSRSVVPKITDFGLAKRLDDDSGQTNTGTVLGTPNYMSPEQAGGKIREVGRATDVYALGAIFYELLIGRPPFKAGNPIDVIRQVIDQEPVPPRQLEPRVPLDIETICLKCLEKQPSRRYQSAEELADDLRRFLADEPILARPISTTERAWKWAKRRPSTVALMVVCVAAVIGTGLFIAWHNISLRDQLDAALAEERHARDSVAKVVEEQRLSQVQIEGQRLSDGARVAMGNPRKRCWPMWTSN